MGTAARALDLAHQMRGVLLDHGVPEVKIELQPGRLGPTDWHGIDPVAVMSHHVASYPTVANPTPGLSLVKRGRSDLPGPLCNGTAGVDLVYRIICLGYANHPGYGGPWTVAGPCGTYTIPKDNARAYAWGTEFEGGYDDATWDRTYTNPATGKSMTFHEFMARCNAGLVEAIWLPGLSSRDRYDDARTAAPGALAGYHGEHSTWTTRKVDRRGYTTTRGRDLLARYDTRTQEDDMFSDDDRATLNRIANGQKVARENTAKRDRALAATVREVLDTLDDKAGAAQVQKANQRLRGVAELLEANEDTTT